ncbi:retrotransposon protein, putative, ty1-copia subclass [Tanacetum coccineum]
MLFTMRETYIDRNPKPIPPAPAVDSAANVLAEWNAIYDAYNEVDYDGISVAAYVLQMKGYVDQLERLGYVLPQDLTVGLILNGLTKDFARFVRNYNMHNMGKTIGELSAMLIEYEKSLSKKAETPQVIMIKGGKIQKSKKKSLKAKDKGKANGKGNDKQVYISKPKNPKPSANEHPGKDDTYHHCKEVGHWKRNCPVYLAELLKKRSKLALPVLQGFREERKLKQESLYLYVGNGVRAQIEAIGSYDLVLPNGLVICLDNCHYAPSITRVIPSNGIYEIDMHDLVPNVNPIYNVSTKRAKRNLDSTYLWHCRLAHISKKRIEKLQQEGLLKSTDDELFDQCVSCLSGKMTRKSFPHRPERATDLLGIIHTYVCDPLRHVSRQGASYFITFTDDYSRYGYVYLLKHKHEVFETFKVFKNEVENQLGKTINALRSDRCGKYISQEFKDYLKACGIVQQLTPPYTPQHNNVSERRNQSASRILNMVPTKKVDKTPYELWYGKILNLSYLKETIGYYFYFPLENKIIVARYAEFLEKNLITQEVSGRAIDLEEIQDEDTSPSEITSEIPMEVEGFDPPQEEVIPIRRSKRIHQAPNRLCLNVEAEEHSLCDLNEPTSYKAAMFDSESNKWIDAMNANNTKGYTQLYEVDYKETFSPVADIRAIRILISIAAFYNYEIWKINVKTAFLNGYLDEDIYMVQHEGFVDPNHPRKVCKVQISIYGLKQALRSWNKRFDEEIKKFGFDQNLDEPCIYQKASGSNVTFLILYVDDIIIMRNYILSLQSVKDYLRKCFAMKDLGEAAFILGIKIYRDRSKRLIGLGQNAYMDKILKRCKMDNSKRGYILMQERLDLNKTQGASTPKEVKRMQNVPYASAVRSIVYAVRCTRPDVAFTNTKDMFLVYGGNSKAEHRVDCYCAVDWKGSKQSTTAMSATKAEYIAA